MSVFKRRLILNCDPFGINVIVSLVLRLSLLCKVSIITEVHRMPHMMIHDGPIPRTLPPLVILWLPYFRE